MKNVTKIALFVALIAISLTACKKNEPEVKQGDRTAFLDKIADAKTSKTETFSVDLDNAAGETITSDEGMQVLFFPGSLKDKAGNIVTGIVEIKLLDVYSKADMLLINKPTMGILPNGDRAILKSGGEFFMTASQNGEELEIASPLMIRVPVDNTNGADNQMILFQDRTEGDCDDADESIVCEENAWEVVEDSSATGQNGLFIDDFVGVTYYTGFISNFGWTNVDRFFSYAGPKTTLLVDVPEGYDNLNCAVYISYDGEPNALAACDAYFEDTQLFSEHYGQIPVGQQIHVIAVSIIDGDYMYSIKAVTVAADEIIVLDDLVATTEAALISTINSLP